MRSNPLDFEHDYMAELGKSLYELEHKKPRNGGNQISIRIGFDIMQHIEALQQKSGWTRNDVIFALVQNGLWHFYNMLSGDKIDEITKSLKLPLNADVKMPERE